MCSISISHNILILNLNQTKKFNLIYSKLNSWTDVSERVCCLAKLLSMILKWICIYIWPVSWNWAKNISCVLDRWLYFSSWWQIEYLFGGENGQNDLIVTSSEEKDKLLVFRITVTQANYIECEMQTFVEHLLLIFFFECIRSHTGEIFRRWNVCSFRSEIFIKSFVENF